MQLENLTIKEVKKRLTNKEKISSELLNKLRNDSRKGINKLAKRVERKRKKEIELKAKFKRMKKFEQQFWSQGQQKIAGIDEAGRGPLAGPVVAAAVILPKNLDLLGLDDSKKLSANKREELYALIYEKAISVGVGIVDSDQIDQINILQASYKAMKIAVKDLKYKPDYLLVDGHKLPNYVDNQLGIEDGDAKSISIAAASIIAKVTRDRILLDFADRYPEYNFSSNKGYGTKEHRNALKEYGPCPIHRRSFSTVRRSLVRNNG